jgi:hypothetical protein
MFTYWECLCSSIVINRDIDKEVGVADLITQEIRSLVVGVVLSNEIIVLRSVGLLVLFSRALLEVTDPLGLEIGSVLFSRHRQSTYPPIDVDV